SSQSCCRSVFGARTQRRRCSVPPVSQLTQLGRLIVTSTCISVPGGIGFVGQITPSGRTLTAIGRFDDVAAVTWTLLDPKLGLLPLARPSASAAIAPCGQAKNANAMAPRTTRTRSPTAHGQRRRLFADVRAPE